MVTIYAIESIGTGKLYVGMTENLQNRLKEHNAGKSTYTASFKPWKVIYSETAENFQMARKREIYLKSTAGKNLSKNLTTKETPVPCLPDGSQAGNPVNHYPLLNSLKQNF